MFVRFDDNAPPPGWAPSRPERPPRSARRQRRLAWLIAGHLLLLLFGLLAGASLIQVAVALVGSQVGADSAKLRC